MTSHAPLRRFVAPTALLALAVFAAPRVACAAKDVLVVGRAPVRDHADLSAPVVAVVEGGSFVLLQEEVAAPWFRIATRTGHLGYLAARRDGDTLVADEALAGPLLPLADHVVIHVATELRTGPAPGRPICGTLQPGVIASVQGGHGRWVQLGGPGGVTGWADAADLVTSPATPAQLAAHADPGGDHAGASAPRGDTRAATEQGAAAPAAARARAEAATKAEAETAAKHEAAKAAAREASRQESATAAERARAEAAAKTESDAAAKAAERGASKQESATAAERARAEAAAKVESDAAAKAPERAASKQESATAAERARAEAKAKTESDAAAKAAERAASKRESATAAERARAEAKAKTESDAAAKAAERAASKQESATAAERARAEAAAKTESDAAAKAAERAASKQESAAAAERARAEAKAKTESDAAAKAAEREAAKRDSAAASELAKGEAMAKTEAAATAKLEAKERAEAARRERDESENQKAAERDEAKRREDEDMRRLLDEAAARQPAIDAAAIPPATPVAMGAKAPAERKADPARSPLLRGAAATALAPAPARPPKATGAAPPAAAPPPAGFAPYDEAAQRQRSASAPPGGATGPSAALDATSSYVDDRGRVVPTRTVSEIVVRVNQEILTNGELETRVREVADEMIRAGATSDQTVVRSAAMARALTQSVEELLLMDEARVLGVRLDRVHEQAKEEFMQRAGIKDDVELLQLLDATGRSWEDFRRELLRRRVPGLVLRSQVTGRIVVDEEELASYYRLHVADWTQEDCARLREIVLRPEGRETTAAFSARLQDVLARLERGEDFCEVSAAFSRSTSATSCGLLEQCFTRTALDEKVSAVVFAMKPGDVEPIRTEWGFHVLKLEERKPRSVKGLAEAREEVLERVRRDKAANLIRQHLDRLRDAAIIEIAPELRSLVGPSGASDGPGPAQ